MANIHTKFDIPSNRAGCLRTLDEIKEIFTDAASIIKIDGVSVLDLMFLCSIRSPETKYKGKLL